MNTKPILNTVMYFDLIGVVFICLKLSDFIDWNWWWVLSPFWIPVAGCVTLLIALLLGLMFFSEPKV